jgi:hypothetical protein
MPSSTEIAAEAYVAAWREPDAAARGRLIEACFAAEGRIVSPGAVIRGRAALAAAIDHLFADPRGLSVRLVGAIDVQGPIFRLRAVVEDGDGRIVFDGFDAAEVDADGRIVTLLAFGASPIQTTRSTSTAPETP